MKANVETALVLFFLLIRSPTNHLNASQKSQPTSFESETTRLFSSEITNSVVVRLSNRELRVEFLAFATLNLIIS